MESIHELLQKRFSPRSFEERTVPEETIRSVLEAARWAPSSYNEQPWRFIVASKEDPEEYGRLLGCLRPGNQQWAQSAPVLMLSVAKLHLSRNDKRNRHARHDVGLAVSQMIVQATAFGLSAHQMGGFDADEARATYEIPEGFDPVTAIAIGYSAESMPANRDRRPLNETAFAGKWGSAL